MEKLNELVERAKNNLNVGNLNFVKPVDILGIAKEFQALEQRTESAEAKLAELEKQEPVAYITEQNLKSLRKGLHDCFVKRRPVMVRPIPLFTRPAPAINLAELVPDVPGIDDAPSDMSFLEASNWLSGAINMRAAILRNIEELK